MRVWQSALVIAALAAACDGYGSSSDEAGSLSGTFHGPVEGSADGEAFQVTGTLTLTEYLGGLSGTFVTNDGVSGAITGSVSGANPTFTIARTSPCAALGPSPRPSS